MRSDCQSTVKTTSEARLREVLEKRIKETSRPKF
jgi:hypothetical protein